MVKLRLLAYPPSKEGYKKYLKDFRAFINANVSEKAKDQGVFISNINEGKGSFPLRIRRPHQYSGGLDVVDTNGDIDITREDNSLLGLRVEFNLIYNSESLIVKNFTFEERTTKVLDFRNSKVIYVTSTAPIIIFGGKKHIWLNKNECESGKAKTMECWTLDLEERAERYAMKGNHVDFAKATELIAQCERVLTEDCTEEELAMIVPVEMSDEDNYQKATPILEKENELGEE